ncbi:MAG TPA: hypothetical protein VKT52_08255, partial [Ktedonobacterales bacterium]|nr:hypothetical protein [Ktedonobacterales bacterium]
NAVDYFGIYYFPDPFVAGAIALVAGLLLGGIAAGLIGGRSREAGGGAWGAGTTGIVAAALYAVSVIALMEAARAFDALPFAVTEHPIRVSLGILFLATLLLLVALVTGIFAGRLTEAPASHVPTRSQPPRRVSAPNAPRPPGTSRPGEPAYGPPPAPPYAQPRYGDAAPPSRPAGPRPSGPQWQSPDASDPRYANARVYGPTGPASRPARRTESDPNHR